jgi:hypothetical protein
MAKQKKQIKEDLKIRFLLNPAGRFLLSYNVGDEVVMNYNQATELVEAAFAEIVTNNV